jgi:hypothetical protein
MSLILAAWMPPDSYGVFVKQKLQVENPQEADFHTLTNHFIFLSFPEIRHHAMNAISNRLTRRVL